MTPQGINSMLERAGDVQYPEVTLASGFTISSGQRAWQLAVPELGQEAAREVAGLLDKLEREHDEQWKRHQRDAPPDEELIRQHEAQARADLAQYVAERPARVEALLSRIAESLDLLAKR